ELFYGTGEGINSTDSFFGSGVYHSTDYGHTWQLLTDPTLTNAPSAGNPLYGLAVNKIVYYHDAIGNVNYLFVATSDGAVNSPQGVGTANTAALRNPGVWRYNLSTNSWFNLTNLASAGRLTGPGVL